MKTPSNTSSRSSTFAQYATRDPYLVDFEDALLRRDLVLEWVIPRCEYRVCRRQFAHPPPNEPSFRWGLSGYDLDHLPEYDEMSPGELGEALATRFELLELQDT